MNLYFRQSIFTGVTFFLTITCIPAFFIEYTFPVLGVDPELYSHVKMLIWASLPSMFVRVFNDNFKTFLQNQGLLKLVGLYSMASFLPFLPIGYFLIVTKNLGAVGIGISLFLYEFLSLNFMLYLYMKKVDAKFKQNTTPVTRELPKFMKLALKLTMVDWYAYIVWDSMNIIVGWIGDKYQLACYSLNYNILLVNFSLFYGLNIFTRTQFNYYLGKKNLEIIKEVYSKLSMQVWVNGAMLVFMDFAIIQSILNLSGS